MNEEYDKIIYTVTSSEDPTIRFVWNWVSVKERLPEEYQKVLVYVCPLKMYDISYLIFFEDQKLWATLNENHQDDITHWMPLPNPPEE